jgi:hypothetical protein
MKNQNENLKDLNRYCREVNIELYGGNDVIEAFGRFWDLAHCFGLQRISFNCNDRKITIEKVKSN